MNKLIQILFLISSLYVYYSYNFICGCNTPPPVLILRSSYRCDQNFYVDRKLDHNKIPQMFLLSVGVIIISWSRYLNLYRHVNYVTFNVALNLHSRKKRLTSSFHFLCPLSLLMFIGFIASEYPLDLIICISLHINPSYHKLKLTRRVSIWVSRKLFYSLCIYMFFTAITPAACMLCLIMFQVCCYLY